MTRSKKSMVTAIAMIAFAIFTGNDTQARMKYCSTPLVDLNKDNLVAILNPVHIHLDPMDKLLLINFEKDPDSVYIALEPQVFNDTINGKGHIVIGWRIDGRVDVYYQPWLTLDSAKYDIAGKGLAHFIATDMPEASFEVLDPGVDAHYKFKDLYGRDVHIRIEEKSKKKRQPFDLLAPMGDAAMNPSSMPLVFLHDFYFVRAKNTHARVSIAGRTHAMDIMPTRMDWSKMYFARYSPRPLIATLNPSKNGVSHEILVKNGQVSARDGQQLIELEWVNEKPAIRSVTRENEVSPVTISFTPGLPDIANVKPDDFHVGTFLISSTPSLGIIQGDYSLSARNNSIQVTMIPSGGWKPVPTKSSTRFLFGVVKVFKKWPTTYRWDAEFTRNDNGEWLTRSGWQRTGRVLK